MCCLDICKIRRPSNGLITSSPSHSPNSPPYQGDQALSVYPWVVGFSTLQTPKLFQQANHIFLQELEGIPPSWYYKVCLPPPLLAPCVPKCNTLVFLHGMWCSAPLGCEYKWLINFCQSHLSNIGGHVFGHPYNSRVRIFICPMLGVMCLAIPIILGWESFPC